MTDEKQKRTRYTGPLDITNLADEAPVHKGGADVDLTQFLHIVQASIDARAAGADSWAKGFTCPAAAATSIEAKLRLAAKQLGVGLAVQRIEAGTAKGNQYNLTSGQARMIVEARDKRKPSSKSTSGETAPVKGLPKPQARQAS